MQTCFPVPPGPVLVPVSVQRNFVPSSSRTTLSVVTTMSGNVVMNACASLAISARPTADGPLLMLIEPPSEKNAATLSGFWLHHASAYRSANLVNSPSVIVIAESAHEQVKLARIQTGFAIVLPRQLQSGEPILVGRKTAIHRLVQIDQAALAYEQDQCRFWR